MEVSTVSVTADGRDVYTLQPCLHGKDKPVQDHQVHLREARGVHVHLPQTVHLKASTVKETTDVLDSGTNTFPTALLQSPNYPLVIATLWKCSTF